MRFFLVKNRSKDVFEDMCAGVPFRIAPGEEKQIDEIAARHIFGLGEEDKTRALTRLGWLQHQATDWKGGKDDAMARLGSFTFTELKLTPEKANGNGNAGVLQTASSPAAA